MDRISFDDISRMFFGHSISEEDERQLVNNNYRRHFNKSIKPEEDVIIEYDTFCGNIEFKIKIVAGNPYDYFSIRCPRVRSVITCYNFNLKKENKNGFFENTDEPTFSTRRINLINKYLPPYISVASSVNEKKQYSLNIETPFAQFSLNNKEESKEYNHDFYYPTKIPHGITLTQKKIYNGLLGDKKSFTYFINKYKKAGNDNMAYLLTREMNDKSASNCSYLWDILKYHW